MILRIWIHVILVGLLTAFGESLIIECKLITRLLQELADEAELTAKFKELFEGAVINTGENRKVLHHLLRGQLGADVMFEGKNLRTFYKTQQDNIAAFAKKVHAGEITNAKGEKFDTVVQIGIGGSDLGPRAMYLALENWAKQTGNFKMEAKFISNVDPDDASSVVKSLDIENFYKAKGLFGLWMKEKIL